MLFLTCAELVDGEGPPTIEVPTNSTPTLQTYSGLVIITVSNKTVGEVCGSGQLFMYFSAVAESPCLVLCQNNRVQTVGCSNCFQPLRQRTGWLSCWLN